MKGLQVNEEEKKAAAAKILGQEPDNSALLKAIAEHADKNTDHTLYTMIKTLVDARVMVPIKAAGKEVSVEGENKIFSVDEGDQVEVLELLDPNQKRVLPLFTDWQHLRKSAPADYGAMVRPTRQACAFAIGAQFDGGAVLNPNASQVLPLTGQVLQAVAAGQLPPDPDASSEA